MTVGELITALKEYEEDVEVMFELQPEDEDSDSQCYEIEETELANEFLVLIKGA